MTAEERTDIQELARRYVREQGRTPPIAVLECVARIVLQARTSSEMTVTSHGTASIPGRPEAA
jgi:hypothetical protein